MKQPAKGLGVIFDAQSEEFCSVMLLSAKIRSFVFLISVELT